MNLVFRIVFSVVVGVIFVSITFSTFFVSKQHASISELHRDVTQKLSLTGSLYYKNISQSESLYSSYEIVEDIYQDISSMSVNIPWKYLSSFRSIWEVHDFTGTGFTISQKWIWEVFVDTITKPWRVFVYAKNTPVEVKLTSDDRQEIYTSIYLAPWMYIEFRTWIWSNLKNADRLRISTVNKLWYISSIFSTIEDQSIQQYFKQEDSFLFDAIQHISDNDAEKSLYLQNLLSSQIPELSGNNYIQKYLHLFVNKEKKKVFYKNIVLAGYISLINTKKFDDSIIAQVRQDEIRLKNIDPESYEQMVWVRDDIVSSVYAMQGSEYITSKLLFATLIDSDINQSAWMYPLYGFSLFSWNTQQEQTSEFLVKSFFDSFAMYMTNYNATQSQYDYFLYFLEKRLLFLLSADINNQNIWSTLEVLSNYTQISNNAEYSVKNQKITQIYSISQILTAIDLFLRDTYFLPDRDNNNLLVQSSSRNLNWEKLSELQIHISSLYMLYEKNSFLLNQVSARDRELSKNIVLVKKNIDEYLLAIWNYSQYQDEYDISKSTILNIDVIKNTQSWISETLWNEYLWQFVWISEGSYSLDVIDGNYYKVENLVIWGRRFDFEIYPYEGSKLKNIFIDGERQTTQYTLDNIELDWDEKFQTAAKTDRDLFDFSRFFIVTFLTTQDREIVTFDQEIRQQESKAEIVFKRDILLWDNWEFSGVSNFLKIDYDDIRLVQQWNIYNIFLDDVDFFVPSNSLNSNNRNQFAWKLNSQYVLNETNHNFKDIALKLESERKWTNNTTLYDFGGNNIELVGTIYINDLEEILKNIFSDINIYMSVYSSVTSTTQWENLVIEYTPGNKKTRFKFDSQQKSFTIILQNWEITGIYQGTSKLASSPIKVSEINDYLQ